MVCGKVGSIPEDKKNQKMIIITIHGPDVALISLCVRINLLLFSVVVI